MAASRVLCDLLTILREKEEVLENTRHQLHHKEKEWGELNNECLALRLDQRRLDSSLQRFTEQFQPITIEKSLLAADREMNIPSIVRLNNFVFFLAVLSLIRQEIPLLV